MQARHLTFASLGGFQHNDCPITYAPHNLNLTIGENDLHWISKEGEMWLPKGRGPGGKCLYQKKDINAVFFKGILEEQNNI